MSKKIITEQEANNMYEELYELVIKEYKLTGQKVNDSTHREVAKVFCVILNSGYESEIIVQFFSKGMLSSKSM